MRTSILEPRPLYAIGTVARLTGLKPDTLRVWERRYGLGASHKSSSGRRQYTQADLEHLLLVADLVGSGVRIGEIASASRKTLEILLQRTGQGKASPPERKPSVLFVGNDLCNWIDEHQGCLSHVSANLARVSLAEAEQLLDEQAQQPDMLIVESGSLGFVQIQQIQSLAASLGAGRVLVTAREGSDRAMKTLQQQNIVTTSFPPDTGFLVCEITRAAAEQTTGLDQSRLGSILSGKSRHFSQEELSEAQRPHGDPQAELAYLIGKLGEFEQRMADVQVADWPETAVAACAYAYTGQARWLVEKALQLMLAPPPSTGVALSPKGSDAGRLHNAA